MKKIITLIVIITMLSMTMQVSAAGNQISVDRAKDELIKSSNTLKKLRYNTYKAKIQYDGALKNSENIGIETMRQIYGWLGWKFDSYTEMMLIKQRDLIPKQTKHYWEVSQSAEITTQNSLIIGLRGLYLALLNADMDVKLKQSKVTLVQKKAEQNKKKYELGLLSKLDLEESDYNLLKAQNDQEASKRNKENACRSLNKLIGAASETFYDAVEYSEAYVPGQIKDLDKYIEKALKERTEIVNTQKEIELKQFEKAILEKNNVGEIYRAARKDYYTIQNEIESLKLKIDKSKLDIENELKKAYIEVKKDESTIKNLKNTIDSQKRNLEKLKTLLKQGMTTDTTIEELQLGINELENAYKMSIYNYNTKLMKLEYAAGMGPAY